MVLEYILSLYQGTNEKAPVPTGIIPKLNNELFISWDCDCSGCDSDEDDWD